MRPTDLPFIIGNDICRIARVRRILKGKLGPQFVRRILRPGEIEHSTTAKILRCILDQDAQRTAESVGAHDAAPNFSRAVEFMAGRFAAKEAVIKAHPYRRLTFQRIAILRAAFREDSALRAFERGDGVEREMRERGEVEDGTQEDGDPTQQQSGPLVAEIDAGLPGRLTYASVSISHDTEYATAVCLGVNSSSILEPGREDPR
ncbi:hypothetical protein F5Y07DRAFT_148794 [Xylaria sp. FL0933]|nr:hypothetical protein F5Y07DRAFT_148794 [Xylaria sp. FL0933]